MAIRLEIYTPEKTWPAYTADKIILPVSAGNLTIIKDRAPRSQVLTSGQIMALDSNNHIQKVWTIDGGLAEIATDVCKIATEKAVEQK